MQEKSFYLSFMIVCVWLFPTITPVSRRFLWTNIQFLGVPSKKHSLFQVKTDFGLKKEVIVRVLLLENTSPKKTFSIVAILLIRWRFGGTSEQVEERDQTGSKDDDHEKGDEVGIDTWAVLLAFGYLAGVDIPPLGDVLVEFAVSVANVSGERHLDSLLHFDPWGESMELFGVWEWRIEQGLPYIAILIDNRVTVIGVEDVP